MNTGRFWNIVLMLMINMINVTFSCSNAEIFHTSCGGDMWYLWVCLAVCILITVAACLFNNCPSLKTKIREPRIERTTIVYDADILQTRRQEREASISTPVESPGARSVDLLLPPAYTPLPKSTSFPPPIYADQLLEPSSDFVISIGDNDAPPPYCVSSPN